MMFWYCYNLDKAWKRHAKWYKPEISHLLNGSLMRYLEKGLEKAMATHSSTLTWKIPETGEPGGLLSMGSHRVGHDWSDLVAAAAAAEKGHSQRNKVDYRVYQKLGPKGNGELLLNSCRVSVWGDENVLKIEVSDGCIILWMWLMLVCTFKSG